MKRILMLGASHFQIPAIKYAKEAGYYVITADFRPDNPGHKYADEYYNVSTVKFNEVLTLSESLRIDGIVSYASDPGAPTAAYVAEKLGLPGNPYDSVLTLQQKDKFRNFLEINGFNVPRYQSFSDLKIAKDYASYLIQEFGAIIVKPVDSSGSKGVTKLESMIHFDTAFNHAITFSIIGKVVIEQFISRKGYQMDGDGFVWNNKLVFSCFGNQHNDHSCHPHVPVGISFPCSQDEKIQQVARGHINKVMQLLDMKVGGINIEYIVDSNDNIYLLEIGPRSGGNLIPEVIKYSTGVDLIKFSVDGALGYNCSDITQVKPDGFYSSYILHATGDGIFDEVKIEESIRSNIIESNIITREGDHVNKFAGSHHTLGTFILKFERLDTMLNALDNMNDHIYVKLKG